MVVTSCGGGSSTASGSSGAPTTSPSASGVVSASASPSAPDSASASASQPDSASPASSSATPSATAQPASPAKPSRPASSSSAASPASLRKACETSNAIFQDFVKQDSQHPNDPKGASKVFIATATRLRKAAAGTPIEKEVNQLAATMQRMGKDLASGADDGSDTATLGKALKPLAKVCQPAAK